VSRSNPIKRQFRFFVKKNKVRLEVVSKFSIGFKIAAG
jgi:hypothetical protein